MTKKVNELLKELVKMADDLDQSGKDDLTTSVDNVIESFAARPKAPLKGLSDDVKKALLVFIHDAGKNTGDSIGKLNEFFRRLRYFDVANSIKDMGLDKVVGDMKKTQDCLDSAKSKFYEMTHGKRPSKSDLEGLFADDSGKELNDSSDFFDAQYDTDDTDVINDTDDVDVINDTDDVENQIDEETEECDDCEQDVLDGEFEFFWS